MGLDITAYSHLKYIRAGTLTEEEWEIYDGDRIDTATDVGFEQSTRGLVDHDVITDRQIAVSVYAVTPETQSHDFRAGSYSGYGYFRRLLAESAGMFADDVWSNPDDYRQKPFFELINFSDAEGCIGPEAAKDLLQDFFSNREAFVTHVAADDIYGYAVDNYDNWIKAFKLASQNGAVNFH